MREVRTPTTSLTNLREAMKEMLLRVEDPAFDILLGMLSLCPQVEVVSISNRADGRERLDRCMAIAISRLRQSGALRCPGDYAYIMAAVNEGWLKDVPYFFTPKIFLDYLRALGLEHLPARSTLYDAVGRIRGRYPDWTFSDAPGPHEELRRRNVVRQFASAFGKVRREPLDGMLDDV